MESRDAAIIRGTLGLASEGITGDIVDMGAAEQADPFDEAIVIHEATSLPYGGDWTGKPGLRALMERIASVANLSVSPTGVEVFDIGDGHVITRQAAVFSAPGTSETLTMPMVEVYKLVDGKIVDIDVFYKDTQAMMDFFSTPAG